MLCCFEVLYTVDDSLYSNGLSDAVCGRGILRSDIEHLCRQVLMDTCELGILSNLDALAVGAGADRLCVRC